MAILSTKDFNAKLTGLNKSLTNSSAVATTLAHAAVEYFMLGLSNKEGQGFQNDQSQLQQLATVLDTHKAWAKGFGRMCSASGIVLSKGMKGYSFSLKVKTEEQRKAMVAIAESKSLPQWAKDESVEAGFSLDAAKKTVRSGIATLIAAGLTVDQINEMVALVAFDEKAIADKQKAIKRKETIVEKAAA
jgi:hypothetical protein